MPDEVKENNILSSLIEIDLQRADPVFSHRYTEAKARTTDSADRMQLDIQMCNRVAELRQEGKMLPVEDLIPRAKAMVDLSSGEMRKGFSDFHREITQAK